jgi:hypothetical protein
MGWCLNLNLTIISAIISITAFFNVFLSNTTRTRLLHSPRIIIDSPQIVSGRCWCSSPTTLLSAVFAGEEHLPLDLHYQFIH